MHEAKLAVEIVDALRAAGVESGAARIRLRVTGGHTEADDFDVALRLHIRALAPDLEPIVEIVHMPLERLCLDCARTFNGLSDEPCPECGGSPLALPVPERIDVELVRPHATVS